MREKEIDKKIDAFTKNLVKEVGLLSPKKSFAASVMQEIVADEGIKNVNTVYQPLIGNKVWFALIAIIIGFVSLLFLQTPANETSFLSALDFTNIKFEGITTLLNSIHISKTLVYSFTILGLMLFLQMPILKSIFQKRWS